MPEVIEQTLACLGGQRQETIFAVFGRPEEDLIPGPIDVPKQQRPYLSAPHTVGVHELKDRVVPPARRSRAIRTF